MAVALPLAPVRSIAHRRILLWPTELAQSVVAHRLCAGPRVDGIGRIAVRVRIAALAALQGALRRPTHAH